MDETDWKHIESILSMFMPVIMLYVHHRWCNPVMHSTPGAAESQKGTPGAISSAEPPTAPPNAAESLS